MRTTGASMRCPKDYSVIYELHQKVENLLDNLPLIFRPRNPDTSIDSQYPLLPRQRIQILCSGNSFLSALHRPHIHIYPKSRRAAIISAVTIIEAQQTFFEMTPRHQYKFFGLAFYTIDAASFLSTVCLVYPPPDPVFRTRINNALQNAITRLKLMEDTNAVASSGVKLISHCYQRMQTSFQLILNMTQPVFSQLMFNNGGGASELDSFMTDDYPRPLNLNSFQQDMYFPPPALEPDVSMDNEFDTNFWMEKMSSIPYTLPEDPTFDPVWGFPMSWWLWISTFRQTLSPESHDASLWRLKETPKTVPMSVTGRTLDRGQWKACLEHKEHKDHEQNEQNLRTNTLSCVDTEQGMFGLSHAQCETE